jgi:hypothetical protein
MLNLLWFIFGLFSETNKLFFRFVSVFRIHIKTTETNRSVSKQSEEKKNCGEKTKIPLLNTFFVSFFEPFFCEIKGPRVLALEQI